MLFLSALFRVNSFAIVHLMWLLRMSVLSSLPDLSFDKWRVVDVKHGINGDESLLFFAHIVVLWFRKSVELVLLKLWWYFSFDSCGGRVVHSWCV